MNKTICLFIIITFCWSCSSNSTTEKHQDKRDNITNVRNQIKEIVIEDVLIGSYSWPQIIDNYIFITDYKTADEFIHIFDKNDFKYITSTAFKGQGPGEITRIGGSIAEDKANRKFYVRDSGKRIIFSYDIDSVIANPGYLPVEKMKTDAQLIPTEYVYINDTLSIASFMIPIGSNDFNLAVGKFNMETGETSLMSYSNPNIKKKRTTFDVSMEYGIYVEPYIYHDLMTICSIDGNLKYNIYGPKWTAETHGFDYFGVVHFCNNRIVALYSGDKSFKDGKTIYPTKFMIFDLEGNYLKTLETGYQIIRFCYDENNRRIIMSMDDEVQFAYLDLDGLID